MTGESRDPISIPELYAQRRVRLLRVTPELLLASLATGNRINVTVREGIPPGVHVAGAYTGLSVDGLSREIVVILVSESFDVAEYDFPPMQVVVHTEVS